MFEEKTIDALKWIIGILKKENIGFRVSGGFASKVYGSNRPFMDIDIEILEKDLPKIFSKVKDYSIFSLNQYKDENWDLPLMTIDYKNQIIDIFAGDNIKIFNQNTKEWEKFNFNLNNFELKNIRGIEVPLIPKVDLLNYKRKLQREVDIIDVANLT